MPDRSRARKRSGGGTRRRGALALDVVLFAPAGDELAVLLTRDSAKAAGRWAVPYELPAATEPLRAAALKLARAISGSEPAWLEQVGAFGDGQRHASDTDLSVAFVGVMSRGEALPRDRDASWTPVSKLPPLAPRQKKIVESALDMLRARLDYAPIAFRLLPAVFTLSDLQQMYELLLGRRLHKASFRRALQAAALVEPIDEWRSEGRGRPAQLFRYAPKKRRKDRRGVRFEQLG